MTKPRAQYAGRCDAFLRALGLARKKLAELQLRLAALDRSKEALRHPTQRRVDADDADPGQEAP